jgi:OmpA-OmpF porin, OOP family
MNSKALLTLLAFLGWILFCNWWWCANKEQCDCDQNATVITDNNTAATNTDGIITFNANGAGAQLGSAWLGVRDSILGLLRSGKRLQITGYYGSQEKNTTTFGNLGLARADSIKQLFIAGDASIGAGRYTLLGELKPDLDGATAPFVASALAALDTIATPKAEGGIVATDTNDIIVYFPAGSANKNLSKEVDDYLIKLAKRLATSGEKAQVIGHTDNKGKFESNMTLSKARAEQVKALLVKDGANAGNLAAEGKADQEPVGDNATDAGRAQNRRVQIKISK